MSRFLALIAALILPNAAIAWQGSGNEPFWSVDIAAGELRLTRLGEGDLSLPIIASEADADGVQAITAADPAQGLRAVLTRRPMICHDTMTGMPHPESIDLVLGDLNLSGCGGAPIDLVAGHDWQVSAIGGVAVLESAAITLHFSTDAGIAGVGGCNRWFATFALTGEGLHIGAIGATKMACAPHVMDQEAGFFRALRAVTGFDIAIDGTLVMMAGDRPVIHAQALTGP
jgi:heat shock protein HslJ